MGLNEAHSTYACLWCKISANDRYIHLKSLCVMKIIYTYHFAERWNMSMDEEVYCQEKARSLSSLKSDSQHSTRHCSKHLGCIHPPLLNIELDNIVVDELHLMLRVGDVLLRNLILYADSRDHASREHRGEDANNLRQLERAIRSCGVSFQIWQK